MLTREQEIGAFVASVMIGAEREPITYEDARITYGEWVKEGMEMPEGLTPEILADEWNAQIERERSMTMSSESRKMVVPCDVAITRYYRHYVWADKDASKDDVIAAAYDCILNAADPDLVLTLDPDLEIEDHDIKWVQPDMDYTMDDDGVDPAKPEPKCRAIEMQRIANYAMNMVHLARPERDIRIKYIKPDDASIQKFTEWERKSKAIRTGDEYFLVYDYAPDWNTDKPDLLYAVNVSIDSLLTAANELLDLLSRKF